LGRYQKFRDIFTVGLCCNPVKFFLTPVAV